MSNKRSMAHGAGEKRLEGRRKVYDALPGNQRQGRRRPGSLKK